MTWHAKNIIYLGRTNNRPPHKIFGIHDHDLTSHLYLLGKTGTGKSTLLKNMVIQSIHNGKGICLIDPHGDLVESVYASIPEDRKHEVIYLNVPEVPNVPVRYGYNPLRYVREDKRSLAASGVLEVFKKLWGDSWGVRMEHILRNAILTLLETPHSNLGDILRLLTDDNYRADCVANLTNSQVKYFWTQEYNKYTYPFRKAAIAPIENKVGAFLADPTIREILIEPEKDLSFRKIMDEGKILLVNLSKGKIGEDASNLLGSLLVTTIGLAAYSRADIPEYQRNLFIFFVDEFQNFTTLSIANMASEVRKLGLSLCFANQYLSQISPEIRDAVLANFGTVISFRLSAKDAGHIARELAPVFCEEDLIHLPNHHIYLRLMIHGAPSQAFSAITLVKPPIFS